MTATTAMSADRRADNPDLHAVLDEIEAAQRYMSSDMPGPPTYWNLALAVHHCIHAVTVLARRTLGREEEETKP